MIRLEHEIAKAIAGMTNAQRDQVPFALSKSINDAVFAVRDDTVNRVWPASVTARNKRFASAAIRVNKRASKRDLIAEIRDTLGRDAFSRQADGGIRRPVSGNHLAIPKIKRNAGGSVPRAMRPRAILSLPGYFKNRKGTAIMRRMKNGTVRLVYILAPNAAIKRRYDAYDEAERTFTDAMLTAFPKNMDIAMRTAFR